MRRRNEDSEYTNSLHEALLQKQGTAFWKCWRSKFEPNKHFISHVDGSSDAEIIAEHFASHFGTVCSHSSESGAARLMNEYLSKRADYQGHPYNNSYAFDAELVENVIGKLKRGKAAGLDNLTCEHLQFSHALLPCILAKLFNMMINIGHVLRSFGQSYTMRMLKSGCNVYGKTITVDDFCGVSISPVISKVLEHCILDRYGAFLGSSDNQFGFKKVYWLCACSACFAV